jgi:hypothetical protein
MPGNNKERIVLTPRDRILLREIAVGKVINRELAKEIAGFKSTTRANTRLLQLTRAGLLKRFFLGTRAGGTKSLYCLSKRGALAAEVPVRLIQRRSDSLLVGDQFIEHQLLVNSIWVQVKFRPIPAPDIRCLRWLTFPSALSKQTPLIPDGYFELSSPSGLQSMFCEVDRGTETLKVWDKKISLYLQFALSGDFQVLFKQSRFRVLVAVHSERRLSILRRLTLKSTNKIFWFATLDDINRHGLFASIWQRPEASQRVALL